MYVVSFSMLSLKLVKGNAADFYVSDVSFL